MADQPDTRRLDGAAVESRLTRLDEALGQLEQMPGRTAELALEAVETLTEVYGEALARITDLAGGSPGVRDGMIADELLRHLLLLHGVHPDPVDRRVARAIDDVRPQLSARGTTIELVGVRDGVARISVSSGSCGCRGTELHDLVRELVLTVAPELSIVDVVASAPAPALIPVTALRRRRDEHTGGGAPTGDETARRASESLALGGTG